MPSDRPKIVSYAAKWDESSPEYAGTQPVLCKTLPPGWKQTIERTAIAAFRALELRDYGRVDFRVAEDGTPYVIDVNTMPGMTETSLVPQAAAFAGIPFEDLAERILLGASLKLG